MQLLIIKADNKNKQSKAHEEKVTLLNIRRCTVRFGWGRRTVQIKKRHSTNETNQNYQHHIKVLQQSPVYTEHNPTLTIKLAIHLNLAYAK